MSERETGTSEATEEQIRQRAYEISQGPDAGSDEENWHRAAEELRRGGSSATDPDAEPS